MKKKLTILAFGLLLAVGWTSSASAQLLPNVPKAPLPDESEYSMPSDGYSSMLKKAPRRGHSDVYANEVSYTKADYAAINYTWYDSQNVSHTASMTDVVTDPYQMYWLLRSTYMNTAVPGILYNDVYQEATKYFGIGRGWDIGSATSTSIRITLGDEYACIRSISFVNATGETLKTWTGSGSSGSFPSSWTVSGYPTRVTINNTYYWNLGGHYSITIPASYISSSPVEGLQVKITAIGNRSSSSTTQSTIWVTNNDYFSSYNITNGTGYIYTTYCETRDEISAPLKNAYTVFLVKVKDYAGTLSTSDAQTYVKKDLTDLFTNYFQSIELLTDGLRVGENPGDTTSGTVFAYQGVLNRFYFISKGKTATYKADASKGFGAYNYGPFYVMYEEFSPTTTAIGDETPDLYQNMWNNGEYYSVVHDCATVLGYEHFFSMYGHDTTVYKSVSPIVLYIPDLRSKSGSRNYEEGHQPQVGLYRAFLTAETEPSSHYAQDSTYTVTLDWSSTLNDMVNNTVNQTYILYTVTFDEQGNRIYHPLDTLVNPETLTYSYDVPQTLGSQQITYVVLAYPTEATNNYPNNGVFYTYSNLDDVQIPGLFDFMVLYRERYESDFIINEEKNYYRNYLYPTNLSHGTGMTMRQLKTEWPDQTASYTLWRDNTGVAVLEVKAIGKKVYYRIRYYDNTQVTTGVNNIEIPNGYQTIPND